MAMPLPRYDSPTLPAAYDDFLVPRCFAPWGELLLSKTGVASGDRVLDVATGPGTLARIAARRTGPQGRVVGTDPSIPMLSIARAKPAIPGSAPIEWIESSADPLAVRDAQFDVVVCHQALQYVPDRRAALAEMRRALAVGGWCGVAVWAPLERCTLWSPMGEALEQSGLGELLPLLRAPYTWNAPDELRVAMHDVEFADVVVETLSLPAVFEGGVDQVLAALEATPLAAELAKLAPETRSAFEEAARRAYEPLTDRGRVRAAMVSSFGIGRKAG